MEISRCYCDEVVTVNDSKPYGIHREKKLTSQIHPISSVNDDAVSARQKTASEELSGHHWEPSAKIDALPPISSLLIATVST